MASGVRCGLAAERHWREQPLVYIHVMKSCAPLQLEPCQRLPTLSLRHDPMLSSGGLSVDAMLKCRCSAANTPCAFLREDGALTGSPIARQNTSSDLLALFKRSKLFGSPSCGGGDACSAAASPAGQGRLELLVEGSNAPCRAQVLATHAPMRWVQSRPLWSRAAYVAVLREPVARVWSFYLCAWPPPSIPAPSARSHARAHARAPRPLLAADIRRKSRRFQEFSLPRVLRAHRLAQRA